MINFFDLVYVLKKQFNGVSLLDDVNETCEKIQQFADKWNGADNTIDMNDMALLFIDIGVLDVYDMNRMFHFLVDLKKIDLFKNLQNGIAQIYNKDIFKKDFNDEKKYDAFKLFLSALKKSKGAVIRGQIPELEDSDIVSDEEVQVFIDSVNELKELSDDQKNLFHLLHFVYENGFNTLNYAEMGISQKDKQKIPLDLKIVVPILEEAYDLKIFLKSKTNGLYKVILNADEYDTDVEYIDAIEKADKDLNVIKYNLKKIREAVDNIERMSGIKTLFKQQMNGLVESANTFKKAAPDAAALFDGDDTLYSACVEITNLDNPENKNEKLNTPEDVKKLENGINAAINYILEIAANKAFSLENSLEDFIKIINKRFEIEVESKDNKTRFIYVDFKEAVEKWKAFIEEVVYEIGFGSNLNNDVSERIKDNQKNAKPPYVLLKDNAEIRVLDMIRDIDISSNNPLDAYDSIKVHINEKKKVNDSLKIKAVEEVVRYVMEFLQTPFREKVDLSQGKMLDKYYDAACNLVYFRDKSLKEKYEPEYNIMLFEKNVIFEANDWTSYFKKMVKKILNYFRDNGIKKENAKAILKYVNYTSFDASVANKDTGTEKSIDELREENKDLKAAQERTLSTNDKLEKEGINPKYRKQGSEILLKASDDLKKRKNSEDSKAGPEETTSSKRSNPGNKH